MNIVFISNINKVNHILIFFAVFKCLGNEGMSKSFRSCDAFRRIALQEAIEELHGFFLFLIELLLGAVLVPGTSGTPKDDLLEAMPSIAVAGDVGLENLTVQKRSVLQLLPPKDACDLEQCIDVVRAVEKGKATRKESEENDTSAPHVDGTILLRALEKHFWSTESTSPRSVCATAGTRLILWVAGCLVT